MLRQKINTQSPKSASSDWGPISRRLTRVTYLRTFSPLTRLHKTAIFAVPSVFSFRVPCPLANTIVFSSHVSLCLRLRNHRERVSFATKKAVVHSFSAAIYKHGWTSNAVRQRFSVVVLTGHLIHYIFLFIKILYIKIQYV